MKADIKEMVEKQIRFSLSLLQNPDDQIEVIEKLIPGAVKKQVSYEMFKIQASAILDKKSKWQLPKKHKKSHLR